MRCGDGNDEGNRRHQGRGRCAHRDHAHQGGLTIGCSDGAGVRSVARAAEPRLLGRLSYSSDWTSEEE